MTQPNYVVPPNPERAEWLRSLQIPPTFMGWTAFRDHELDLAENGMLLGQAPPNYTAVVVDKLVAAQLDTISVLTNLQQSAIQTAESVQALFYKKKEAAPGDTTTAGQQEATDPMSQFLSMDFRKLSGR
ncbi:hypothetical protein [Mycobacterium marinum]|uniref:hypothetical protein n=1 Tax=Mycobacterium marinum TaxID=1781 RepID=UPI001920E941|nr:hypothetical protein [Mycobacterium marinum]QQW35234.1 hypothetical protein HXW97_16300 [Mycobacterium marinum]